MGSSELTDKEVKDQFNDAGFKKHKLKTTIFKMFGKISSPVATDNDLVSGGNSIGQHSDRSYAGSIIGNMNHAWKRFKNNNKIAPYDGHSRNVM